MIFATSIRIYKQNDTPAIQNNRSAEGIDTEFEVMAVTPQTPKCHHNRGAAEVVVTFGSLWCHSHDQNEVSISILKWYHKINFKLVDVVKPNCFSASQV